MPPVDRHFECSSKVHFSRFKKAFPGGPGRWMYMRCMSPTACPLCPGPKTKASALIAEILAAPNLFAVLGLPAAACPVPPGWPSASPWGTALGIWTSGNSQDSGGRAGKALFREFFP